ncbi:MAG: thioredoxin family protein [Flammeovirgaceae bacterium]
MNKSIVLFLLLAGSAAWAQTETEQTTKVNWLTFEEAVEKSKNEKRKLFVDVYTDWCGYCKMMDKNTFSDPEIAKLLNERFYPVKFNAEQREDVNFQGTLFKFIEQANVHQLAALLLNNKLGYPTFAFVEEDFSGNTPYPGYHKPKEFHAILSFFLGNYHKKNGEEQKEFSKAYQSPYADQTVKPEGEK